MEQYSDSGDESNESIYTDTEVSSTDSESENEFFDNIYESEADFQNQDKVDGEHYIGLYLAMSMDKKSQLVMASAVSAEVFFQYSAFTLQRYLQIFSGMQVIKRNLEIMQLHILQDGSYSVVLKTYWLRILQRRIRKRLADRKNSQHYKKYGRVWFIGPNKDLIYPASLNTKTGLLSPTNHPEYSKYPNPVYHENNCSIQ